MPSSLTTNNNNKSNRHHQSTNFMISSFSRRSRASSLGSDDNDDDDDDDDAKCNHSNNEKDQNESEEGGEGEEEEQQQEQHDPFKELYEQDENNSVDQNYGDVIDRNQMDTTHTTADEKDEIENDQVSSDSRATRNRNYDNDGEQYFNNEDFSNFEEELGLHEAMLESLNEKLKALDNDIAVESKFLVQCNTDIDTLTKEQTQLRRTRETNMNLMKNVTLTMNKCFQRLRRKLDDKTIATSKMNEDDESTDFGNNDNDRGETVIDNIILNDELNNCIDDNNQRHQSFDQNEINQEEEPSFIFKDSIPVKPIHHDQEYLQKMWSQNYPSNCPIFQHPIYLQEPLFPLHPPISCPVKLERMVYITQLENSLRRREIIEKGDKALLEADYKNELRGTCLDIYSSLQYDPFYINNLSTILKSNAYDKDGDDDDNSNDGQNEVKEASNSDGENQNAHQSDINENPIFTFATKDTKTHNIDPNTIICRYDLMGTCNDPFCPYQHLNSKPRVKRVVKKKGMNKITVATKQTAAPKQRSVEDYIVRLPDLSLPPLPSSTFIEKSAMNQCLDHHNPIPNASDKNESYEANGDEDSDMKYYKPEDINVHKGKSVSIRENITPAPSAEIIRNSVIGSSPVEDICLESNPKKRKASEIDGGDNINDEFIKLPSVSSHDSDGSTDGEDIEMTGDEISGEDMEQEKQSTNNDIFEPSHLFDALELFNFKIIRTPLQVEGDISVSYSNSYSHVDYVVNAASPQMNRMKHIMNSLTLIADIVDATRLCIYAGRIDICRSLYSMGKTFLESIDDTDTNDPDEILKEFLLLSKMILADIERFYDGSLCGSGSISFVSSFYVQLGLSVIAYFIRSYRQATLEEDDFIIDKSDRNLVIRKYKRFTSSAFGKSDMVEITGAAKDIVVEGGKSSFPYHLIPKEKICMNFTSVDSSPKNRLGRVIECFVAGQNIANFISKEIFGSVRYLDPQLILDDFLIPLSSLVQNHVVSSKSSVAEDFIDNTLNGEPSRTNSVGLPTQLCIFGIFGPSVISCFSAMFLYANKKADKLGYALRKESTSRHQGILIEAKKMIMMFIELFDQSAIAGENFEGRLLLTPYFILMANLLTITGSYSKTQVLLENAIFSGDNSARVWSIYSESLWSLLIQLRSCFQPPDSVHGSKDLVNRPLRYGLNITGFNLKGDSHLVRFAAFFKSAIKNISCQESMKRAILNSRKACLLLSNIDLTTNTLGNLMSIIISYGLSGTFHKHFPQSILLSGASIQSLSVNHFELKRLPYCFGNCLPRLKTLDLSQNCLESLPNSLERLEELEKLNIDGNNFERIPQVLSKLLKLKIFSAAENSIMNINPLLSCKGLVCIDLRSNNIKHIPPEMALELRNLSKLDIDLTEGIDPEKKQI